MNYYQWASKTHQKIRGPHNICVYIYVYMYVGFIYIYICICTFDCCKVVVKET